MKKSIVIWSIYFEKYWAGNLSNGFLWCVEIQNAKKFEAEDYALLETEKVICNPKLGVAGGQYYELKTIYSKEP